MMCTDFQLVFIRVFSVELKLGFEADFEPNCRITELR